MIWASQRGRFGRDLRSSLLRPRRGRMSPRIRWHRGLGTIGFEKHCWCTAVSSRKPLEPTSDAANGAYPQEPMMRVALGPILEMTFRSASIPHSTEITYRCRYQCRRDNQTIGDGSGGITNVDLHSSQLHILSADGRLTSARPPAPVDARAL
jgi:hypothetical protein